MVKEERKPRKVDMWPKFPPWEHVEYKNQTKHYFKIVRRLNNEGLNPKTKTPPSLVTKVDITKKFGHGFQGLKTTNPYLHPDTKKELVKLYW
jgi:hypothetical protein